MQIVAKRFTSISLFPHSQKEFFEASNAGFQSCIRWPWSSLAAIPSDSFSPQKSQNKVTKKERREMVLAFVEKYRDLNDGKFPSAYCTQKQVGGSYYVARAIIQELKFYHKGPPPEIKKEIKILGENTKCEDISLAEEPCILADTRQISLNHYVGDTTEVKKQHSSNANEKETNTTSSKIEGHSDNHNEIDAHRQPSRVGEESLEVKGLSFNILHVSASPMTVKPQTDTPEISEAEAMNAGDQITTKLETKTSILHTYTEEVEVCRKDAPSTTNAYGKVLGSDEFSYDQRRQLEERAEEPSRRSDFWSNLKSMAFGIISLWKK